MSSTRLRRSMTDNGELLWYNLGVMQTLTDKQQSILDFIVKGLETNGYAPTVREIGEHVGLGSTASAKAQIDRLEVKGYILREQYGRNIILLENGKPVLWKHTRLQ